MATVEVFPGEDKVTERNLAFAKEQADYRAMNMANRLIGYVGDDGPIPRDGYRAILASEREKEMSKVLGNREAGLANDKHSTSPGITALLIEGSEPFFGSEEVRERLEGGFTLSPAGELDGLKFQVITMPDGFYEETTVGVRFSVRGYVDEIRVHGAMEDSFIVDHQNVVRIVGFEGDLWQNERYNPDGTRTDFEKRRLEIER